MSLNNILTFEDYRNLNIRQVESVIYHQFIEKDIKDEVNEAIVRKAINKAASNFIQSALAEEIEKGKELEKSIKEALDGLDKGFEEIKKRIEGSNSKNKLSAIEKVKEAIKAVQSQAFDTLTMIGSEGEIDFAGFMGSASVAAAANFGVLFTPIRSLFITRKAYKYFLGLIKQTIRRNLLVIQLNFDQFENLILQKSFESEEDTEFNTKLETMNSVLTAMTFELCDKKNKFLKGRKNQDLKDKIEVIRKNMSDEYKRYKENSKHNPLSSLWSDQHNNTYTRTLEQIKQYINDDTQKELDALKNSITKMSGNDVELIPYGELLISAAEEYAIHTNHGINNNFIKMSSVFNLDNQKKLIELIVASQKEEQEENERKQKNIDADKLKKKQEQNIETGKKIYEEKLKDSTENYTIDKFEEVFSNDDIECIQSFFQTDDGQQAYKELVDKNPIYKYIVMDDVTLNTLLSSINDLKLVTVSEMDDFYKKIVNKNQTLYYTMCEKSIKDAVKSISSTEYFGYNIKNKYVDKNYIKPNIITKNTDIINEILGEIITTKTKNKITTSTPKMKKKYFLTFNGSGNNLFNILHNDFKTTIIKDNGTEYESDIHTKNKENIIKLIHKNLNFGNNISTQLAEYLVRLEYHMLLENKKPWYVVKNNEDVIKCFDQDADKIPNKNAFVEINEEDYEDIKKFLTRLHDLSEKDFDINNDKNEEKKE